MNLARLRVVVPLVSILLFPAVSLAALSENTILQSNQAISLDTGAIASSGGDLQGSAKVSNLPNLGANGYNLQPATYFNPGSKSAPIASLPATFQ